MAVLGPSAAFLCPCLLQAFLLIYFVLCGLLWALCGS